MSEDDRGQFDGETFATRMSAQPWVRMNGQSPWHLWGNGQVITTIVEVPTGVSGRPANPGIGQLVKVSYRRPTSWNWFFSSKLLEMPNSSLMDVTITVDFELTIGIGRSVLQMYSSLVGFGSSGLLSPTFERHTFIYGTQQQRNLQIWSSKVHAPPKLVAVDTVAPPPDPPPLTVIDSIVAQDIQLQARVLATSQAPNPGALGGRVQVEVQAFFAPVVHVRPDWFMGGHTEEERFAGEETGGR